MPDVLAGGGLPDRRRLKTTSMVHTSTWMVLAAVGEHEGAGRP